MREQELINLHALLFEVRAFLERADDIPSGSFEDYDAQPVRPAHIHRRKEVHERAINLLLSDIVECVQRPPLPDQTVPT